MSVRYCIQKKKNPSVLTAPEKYYLIQKSLGHINRKELIEDMVRNTSLTRKEAETGIDYLFEAFPRFLGMGFTVQLGELGYFRTTIRSEGSDTAEEAIPDKIKQIKLSFVSGNDVREKVNHFAVEKFPIATNSI